MRITLFHLSRNGFKEGQNRFRLRMAGKTLAGKGGGACGKFLSKERILRKTADGLQHTIGIARGQDDAGCAVVFRGVRAVLVCESYAVVDVRLVLPCLLSKVSFEYCARSISCACSNDSDSSTRLLMITDSLVHPLSTFRWTRRASRTPIFTGNDTEN